MENFVSTDMLGIPNPARVPAMFWNIIEPYFSKKYNITVVQSYPEKAVDRPSITWRVMRRQPGDYKGVARSRGASYYAVKEITLDGQVVELHTQIHTVRYEWAVFGTSNAQVDDMCWDLENYLIQTVGVIQSQLPGFTMSFEEQMGDSTLLWRAQDELLIRTLRFVAQVPVSYVKQHPALRFINVEQHWGKELVIGERTVRTDSPIYYAPVPSADKVVVSFVGVFLFRNGQQLALKENTDFTICLDDNQVPYIKWNDNYGLTPNVGEEFRVDFNMSQIVDSSH